jgi:ABC-type multidrug transport system ATPase subunit
LKGKTTLLDCLAGRLQADSTNVISGSLLINGRPRDAATFRQMSAYVLQEDYFIPEMTVRETIEFSATLRLPSTMLLEEKRARVDQVCLRTTM